MYGKYLDGQVSVPNTLSGVMNKSKETPLISRGTVDILNSLSWFFMDAFWMLQFPKVCVCCIIPTAISGIALFFTNKTNKPLMLMDISTNCWIWMNFFWILQDMWNMDFMMPYVKALTIIGICCLLAAIKMSDDLAALFSHFGPSRRFSMGLPRKKKRNTYFSKIKKPISRKH